MLLFKKRGFTLLEVLIVIVIIGILTTIILTNYIGYREEARKTGLIANFSQIRKTAILTTIDNNSYLGLCDGEDFETTKEQILKLNFGQELICLNNDNYYCVSTVFDQDGQYYCIDSSGFFGDTDGNCDEINLTCP